MYHSDLGFCSVDLFQYLVIWHTLSISKEHIPIGVVANIVVFHTTAGGSIPPLGVLFFPQPTFLFQFQNICLFCDDL